MAYERPETRSVGESAVCAQRERAAPSTSAVDELLNENKRLREIVVFLSEIIIRDAVGRR